MTLRTRLRHWLDTWLHRWAGRQYADRHGVHLRSFDARYADARAARRRER